MKQTKLLLSKKEIQNVLDTIKFVSGTIEQFCYEHQKDNEEFEQNMEFRYVDIMDRYLERMLPVEFLYYTLVKMKDTQEEKYMLDLACMYMYHDREKSIQNAFNLCTK